MNLLIFALDIFFVLRSSSHRACLKPAFLFPSFLGFREEPKKRGSDSDNSWWYYDIDWIAFPPEYGDRSVVNVPVMLNGRVPSYEVFKYEDRSSAWKTWNGVKVRFYAL